MAAKKLKVEFVKRYEDRDKNGDKVVIPAGTVMSMTAAQVKSAGAKVRLVNGDSAKDSDELDNDPDTGGDGDPGAGNGEEGSGD